MSKRRGWLLILLAVLLVAGGLRVWGCFGQGYPFSFYPDEEGNVKRALRFGQARTLNPGWFSKPALGYYVLFAEYGAYYVVGRITGRFGGVDDFAFRLRLLNRPFERLLEVGNEVRCRRAVGRRKKVLLRQSVFQYIKKEFDGQIFSRKL